MSNRPSMCLIRNIILLVLILGFWVPMLTFFGKYADALTGMEDDAEEVAAGYELMLQRGIFATRIATAVLGAALVVYVLVKIFRGARRSRTKRY